MYNWKKPYQCKVIGCKRKCKTMRGMVRHSKTIHQNLIKKRSSGMKPIFRMAWK